MYKSELHVINGLIKMGKIAKECCALKTLKIITDTITRYNNKILIPLVKEYEEGI